MLFKTPSKEEITRYYENWRPHFAIFPVPVKPGGGTTAWLQWVEKRGGRRYDYYGEVAYRLPGSSEEWVGAYFLSP